MNREQSRAGGLKRWGLLVAVLLLAAASAFVGWRWLDGGRVEKKLRLVALKNEALSELENERLERAIELLEEIAAGAPMDPFGPRNLAVARLLQLERLEKLAPHVREEQLSLARESVSHLMAIEGQEAIAHWIDARVRRTQEDETGQLASLAEAAKRMPENAAIWFEIYDTLSKSQVDERRANFGEELEKAVRYAPENYTVLTDWLPYLAQRQDPRTAEELEKAKVAFAPLRDEVLRFNRHDIISMLDAAIASATAGEWRRTFIQTSQFRNVSRPNEHQLSDWRRVGAHTLSFVLTDFAPDFYRDWESTAFTATPVDRTFAPADVGVLPSELKEATGVALTDFDLNGSLDIVVSRPGMVEAHGRKSAGDPWTKIAGCPVPAGLDRLYICDLFRTPETDPAIKAEQARARDRGEALSGILSHASDKPGCQDMYQGIILFGSGGLRIARHDPINHPGAGALAIVDQPDELENLVDVRRVGPIDFDNDGDLDLVVLAKGRPTLWMNHSDSTFSAATEWSQLPGDAQHFSDLAIVDFDRDVDLDVLLTGDESGSLGCLENLRHGRFRWTSLAAPFYDTVGGATAIAAAEIDGNASWDIVGAGSKGIGFAFTMTPSAGVVVPKGGGRLDARVSAERMLIWDFDNDGQNDLLVLAEGKLLVFRGEKQQFVEVAKAVPDKVGEVQDFDIGDYDDDGDLDLAVVSGDGVTILGNNGQDENQWMKVRIRGQADNKTGRSNHYGIGSLVEMRTKTGYQARTVDRQIVHFGLGQDAPADAMRIVWTTGIPQAHIQPAQNRQFCEPMIMKSSCPLLYTWTGERFEFFTDLLWAAPLGLQQAEGVLAPCRPWEYIKIPGDKLAMKDGAYEMQVTCELWEADYFDRIELIAIDHPGDVEIYSNEKVGPAEIAEFKVHTVMNRRTPIAARDKAGRDVLPLLAEADGKYMQGFERTFRQGLTEEHYLELDLGEFTGDKATLFLTGWIRPTDTSINISLSQDPTLDAPRPPYLLAPDANGQWREVRPFMGFPGGKPKAIAIDLAGVFTGNDHRLRIATSNEIYWDEAFFTVDEPATETRVTPLSLLSADLHYRGFSRVRPWEATQPETYDYGVVETAPKWPPMGGKFTRYGDVKELLASSDNRLVIMSSGDETTLRFAAPSEPPPAGWKRNFFLHSRGWDKDADLNTVHGQTVEPLPFAEMKSYPYEPNESYPDTPALRAWQREYQTREVDPNKYWKQVMRETK